MADIDSKIAQLEGFIEDSFTDKRVAAESLQMGAGAGGFLGVVTIAGAQHFIRKNTFLAIVGDAVMGAVMSEEWYNHYNIPGQAYASEIGPKHVKEEWNRIRQDMLSNKKGLGPLGKKHGIDKLIITNGGTINTSNGMVATTIEAICGAAHLNAGAGDAGYAKVRFIMQKLDLFDHPLLQVT